MVRYQYSRSCALERFERVVMRDREVDSVKQQGIQYLKLEQPRYMRGTCCARNRGRHLMTQMRQCTLAQGNECRYSLLITDKSIQERESAPLNCLAELSSALACVTQESSTKSRNSPAQVSYAATFPSPSSLLTRSGTRKERKKRDFGRHLT
jgi:hypothetical protein